jgi:rhodanese-related sulfurtransferase
MLKYLIYLLPLAALGYLLWSRRSAPTLGLKAMLEQGAQVVDVRTRAEFQSHAHPRCINIPLDQLAARAGELDRTRPVIVCCETGGRSGIGVSVLKRSGFSDVANLGSWRRLQSLLA